MKKGIKILIICIVAVIAAVAALFIVNRAGAEESPEAQYAQGIDAGSDTATVDIDIRE